jgi:hypothetical protein
MEHVAKEQSRSVGVTGLPEDAIRAVESLVAAFRVQSNGAGSHISSADEWSRALRDWAHSHRRLDTAVDWSRESIYRDRDR